MLTYVIILRKNTEANILYQEIGKNLEETSKLSTEKDDECKIYAQWDFSHTEDSGEADSQCPCGKTGIRYLCYITNKITKKSTFVGTSCVEFFDEEMKEVLKLVLNLISVGITGKYKGEGVGGKKRFEIRANTTLAKKESRLKALFQNVPLYQKGNGKWEMQVFTDQQGFIQDQSYELKIQSESVLRNWHIF